MNSLSVLLFSAVSMATIACKHECEDIWVAPAYRITVLDSETKAPLCGADVTVNAVPARSSSIDCTYVLEIRSGEHAVIAASHSGYGSASVTMPTTYTTDSCDHAVPVPVTIELASPKDGGPP